VSERISLLLLKVSEASTGMFGWTLSMRNVQKSQVVGLSSAFIFASFELLQLLARQL